MHGTAAQPWLPDPPCVPCQPQPWTPAHPPVHHPSHPGISPIKALIESGALAGRRSVRLYYGTRTPEHMAFAQSIEAWSSEHGVTVLPVFSSSSDGYVQDAFARVSGERSGQGACWTAGGRT